MEGEDTGLQIALKPSLQAQAGTGGVAGGAASRIDDEVRGLVRRLGKVRMEKGCLFKVDTAVKGGPRCKGAAERHKGDEPAGEGVVLRGGEALLQERRRRRKEGRGLVVLGPERRSAREPLQQSRLVQVAAE